jgi:hypothetical protein
MKMNSVARFGLLSTSLVIALAACSDSNDTPTGPGGEGTPGSGTVSLSVAVAPSAAPSFAAGGGILFDIVQNDGTSELVIQRVAMVLREIELERQFDDDCDDHVSGDDDDCEEFSTGPMILELPMDGTVDQVISIASVPADIYDEIEFEIHKPEDNTTEDLAFIQAHPEFERVSIRVEGTFDGESFTYLTDLNEEQEYALVPPLEVGAASGPVNVTLSIDVSTWFLGAGGDLIDPRSANDGGPNEQLVEDNIERSIDAFEDVDRDGEDDTSSDDPPGDDNS